jgi:hypothetical protein
VLERSALTKYLIAVITLSALASYACGNGGSSDTEQASTGSPASSPGATNSPGLPPCQSATATNCDASNLQQSSGTHGSAGCSGQGVGTISASPIDLNEILYIQPMGLMVGGHVTPIDHGYFYIKGAFEQPSRQTVVKSPFAGVITSVSRTPRQGPDGNYDDYALTIEATCTFRVRFSNLDDFAGAFEDNVGDLQPGQSATPNYKVAEGELIGHTGLPTANGIDVWVENDNSTLTGFVNPAQYTNAESWKTHVVDFFDYTSEPLKSALLALDLRDASPRFGKIDYDVDGKLIGTWFRQGSGGYSGKQSGGEGYWDGHLSVVPDGNDPSQIVISFGNYRGQPQQFAVIGNTPDPATVNQATGLVTYELGQIATYSGDSGQTWDGMSYIPNIKVRASTPTVGTVLMQLVGDRQLKMEVFPGATAAQVAGFDSNALIYER